MFELYSFVVAHYQDGLALLGAVISLASVIVRLTPTPRDDTWLAKVRLFLRRLSVPGFADEKKTIYVPKERPLIAQRLDL